jgi:hypothetical protein
MDKTADKWITGIDKHELKGDHFMAQQQGVFGSAIDLDGFLDISLWIKQVKLFYIAIETDFDKINETLAALK